MAITTYAKLKEAVIEWSKRGDINTVVDDFIDLAEAEMWQHLRIRDMEERTTSLSISGRLITLPSDYVGMRRLRYYSGSKNYDLNYQSPESMQIHDSAGMPSDYTVAGDIELDRTPSGSYTWEMLYFKSLTALSSSNTSNAVLTRFPAVYLNGCLWALAKWARKEPMAIEGEYQEFMRAITNANKVDRRGRKGAAPQMRPPGSTP